jgi:hypothetical protein
MSGKNPEHSLPARIFSHKKSMVTPFFATLILIYDGLA